MDEQELGNATDADKQEDVRVVFTQGKWTPITITLHSVDQGTQCTIQAAEDANLYAFAKLFEEIKHQLWLMHVRRMAFEAAAEFDLGDYENPSDGDHQEGLPF